MLHGLAEPTVRARMTSAERDAAAAKLYEESSRDLLGAISTLEARLAALAKDGPTTEALKVSEELDDPAVHAALTGTRRQAALANLIVHVQAFVRTKERLESEFASSSGADRSTTSASGR